MPSTSSGSAGGRLSRYQQRRDFARTPEPADDAAPEPADDAAPGAVGAPRFVVQRHRARRLHYDFRLEIDGVLASWAVPKGPTLDPAVRRAAFRVEDHPIEYLDFEGVIPAGEYGGGDVIVWDSGTWQLAGAGDPSAPGRALAEGELHLDMYGQKLRGRFVLVRTSRGTPDKQQWLLLHKRDQFAVSGWNPEDHPLSVHSGRTNEQVKADPARLWRSDLPAASAAVALSPPSVSDDELRALDGLRSRGTWHVFGRELRVSNLDQPMFAPAAGEAPVTKRELLRYTAQIAGTLAPYLNRRALDLYRFPGGADAKGFWQHRLPDHPPEWLPRGTDPEADPDDTRDQLVADEPAALVWAASVGALEWRAGTAQVDHPHQPTYALFNLDSADAGGWRDLLVLARLHREAFAQLGLRAGAKLTGDGGIQIWVPIARGPDFASVRGWVEQFSRAVDAVAPELVSERRRVSQRNRPARLDHPRNAIDRTVLAPYSPRPAPGAPVSAPVGWDELDDPDLTPDVFTIRSILRRLADRGDLFRDVLDHSQVLPVLR